MMHTAQRLREMNEHEVADLLLQKNEDAKRQAVMSNEILSQDNLNEELKLSEKIEG